MKMQPKCYTCGATELETKYSQYQYVLEAYGDQIVHWSYQENLISKDWHHESWQLGQYKKPELYQKRVVSVGFPFSGQINETFWVYYMNPDYRNMDITKTHIEESAFIRCKILSLIDSTDYTSWLLVEIVETIDTMDITKKIPEMEMDSEFLRNFYFFEGSYFDCFDNWIHYSGSAQGDISESILIYNHRNKYNVVTFHTDTFHNSWNYLTNISIPEKLVFEYFIK